MMIADYQIRRAMGGDIGEILALDRGNRFQPHWPVADYAAALHLAADSAPSESNDARRCLFVAELGGTVVGVAAGMVVTIEQEILAELESVGVSGTARRQGIGRALCIAVISWCRNHGATEIELEVRSASEGPLAMYGGMEFVEFGRRPKYYRDPVDDAVLMRLQLAPGDAHGHIPA